MLHFKFKCFERNDMHIVFLVNRLSHAFAGSKHARERGYEGEAGATWMSAEKIWKVDATAMLIAGSFQPLFGLSTVTINYDKGECNDNLWLYDTNVVVRCFFSIATYTAKHTYYHNYQHTADRLNIWSHDRYIVPSCPKLEGWPGDQYRQKSENCPRLQHCPRVPNSL